MFRNLFICIAMTFTFFYAGCNKDEQTSEPDRKTLLTAHSWKIKALLYRPASENENSDFTSYVYGDCERDDIYTFRTDSTFIRDDNIVKCSIANYFGPYGTGSWTGNTDLTQFTISATGYSIDFAVNELTSNSFIIEQATKDGFENDIVYTYQFEPVQ